MASTSMNFSRVRVLIVDGDEFSVGIVTQILRGYGVGQCASVATGAEAKDMLLHEKFNFVICEAVLSDMTGGELVRWMRNSEKPQIKFMPVVVLTGHAQVDNVTMGRDSGAHIVVRKPVSPSVLFDRLVWAVKNPRPFLEAPTYIGPDRRFKPADIPEGEERRGVEQSTPPENAQHDVDATAARAKSGTSK
jgi:CheY-like chemotaxis protein